MKRIAKRLTVERVLIIVDSWESSFCSLIKIFSTPRRLSICDGGHLGGHIRPRTNRVIIRIDGIVPRRRNRRRAPDRRFVGEPECSGVLAF